MLFSLLLVTSLMSLTVRERERITVLEQAILEALAPLQTLANNTVVRVEGFFRGLAEMRVVYQENLELRDQVGKLKASGIRLQELEQENKRLRALLGFIERGSDFRPIPARVIGRDPSNFFSTILLDKGSRNGVSKDLPVVTGQGLAGRVIAVSPTTSRVRLITDPASAVGARLQSSRFEGVVEGTVGTRGELQLIHLSQDAKVVTGEIVITSGLGGIFPSGIGIGSVKGSFVTRRGLERVALVEPFVDFQRIEEVMVMAAAAGPTGEEQ